MASLLIFIVVFALSLIILSVAWKISNWILSIKKKEKAMEDTKNESD